jgi:7-cyano-7-deazaguanine synthase
MQQPGTTQDIPKRAIVLVSGGLDSAVALACARRDGFEAWALSFDYGQRHHHELDAAPRVAASLGAHRHVVLKLDLTAIGGSALTADIDVPKDRPSAAISHGIPPTYVPARNLIFLSCAAAQAEVARARNIYIGVNAVDYSGYPDCRAEFIRAFEQAANLGTKAGVEGLTRGEPWLRVRTPLVDLTKAQIIRLGAELGVDFSQTHSCYDPIVRGERVLACGRCDSCQIRARGFTEAGVTDPTEYAAR